LPRNGGDVQNVDPQHVTTASVVPERGTDRHGGDAEGAVRQDRNLRTLGTAPRKAIDAPAQVFLLLLAQLALTKTYRKWAEVLLLYSIKTFAVSIAWMLRRVVSSFHSAIRGGLMFSIKLLGYLSDMGLLGKHYLEGYIPYVEKVLGYSIALLGL
jgi:hypothetical protein